MGKSQSSLCKVGEKTLTGDANKKDKEIEVPSKSFIAFFIGGAADKKSYYGQGPTALVNYARLSFVYKMESLGFDKGDLRSKFTHHIGYDDAKGEEDVKSSILNKIEDKDNTYIYLIGHSLGAWNAAHLSSYLMDEGYKVEYLVTLDPVGEGILVGMFSDIYWGKPEPKYAEKNWINIRAEFTSGDLDVSDKVADFGEQWNIKSGPNINETLNIHHANADLMFGTVLSSGRSALDFISANISKKVKVKNIADKKCNDEEKPNIEF
ncbi:hypothetical protein R6242_19810 [Iodobacter sp. CM08]|uniref:hypothetical protein n=1 Tax=Iodobacter sp. CM08 TaxID=3085902 RepID=UPI002980DD2D|nr:hypothetical protein [Iodobacter sp. CM08]MDW5418819.1 hypothetical protein [Iodobacter sp. CM08]